ncbi:MAG TPA: hypothetical protein DDW65_18210 [Firmicutes bacterium]|jgi:hypothetical protein|nr:hypothetical protein [Bacillota bacterium]
MQYREFYNISLFLLGKCIKRLDSNEYRNGVQQVFMVYRSQDRYYKDIEQDFMENSKEISF